MTKNDVLLLGIWFAILFMVAHWFFVGQLNIEKQLELQNQRLMDLTVTITETPQRR